MTIKVTLKDGRVFEQKLFHLDQDKWFSLAFDYRAHPEIPDTIDFDECAAVIDENGVDLLAKWTAPK